MSLLASPDFSHLSWDSPNQVHISQCKYFRKLLRTIYPEYKKKGKWVFNSKHNTLFEKLQRLHSNVCIIFYSVGRRAAGSHWQQSKKKWKFSRTGCAFLSALSTPMKWRNTTGYSGHVSTGAAPQGTVFQVQLTLPESLTWKAIFHNPTWPCCTREETYIHTNVCMLTHRWNSISEHKLHSDIKAWVAISEFPMATISYGPTLA